jgi:DNA-binding NtrC family response regulator
MGWPELLFIPIHNKDRTARALGLGRSSLYRRLKEWGLDSEDEE